MPDPLSYAPPNPRRPRLRPRHLLGVILALTIVTYAHYRTAPPAPRSVAKAPAAPTPAEPSPTQVYNTEIVPLLTAFDARNDAAADRALSNLHERLTGRRWGIKPFVADVSSWKTRFSVINRKRSDLWQHHLGGNP